MHIFRLKRSDVPKLPIQNAVRARDKKWCSTGYDPAHTRSKPIFVVFFFFFTISILSFRFQCVQRNTREWWKMCKTFYMMYYVLRRAIFLLLLCQWQNCTRADPFCRKNLKENWENDRLNVGFIIRNKIITMIKN